MNDSPYSRVGARLVDQGYSAIPVFPSTKRPGSYSRGHWVGDMDWTRFCTRLPTQIEIDTWVKWPDAGVCVALGPASGGLVAIDVDADDPQIIAAIEAALPEPSPVQKMGKKGYTAFYRASPAVASTAFNVLGGVRALDLLAAGKQTVIPPTLHPDTGRAYAWITEATLETVTTDRLPALPDDIAARLGAALEPFGYHSPVARPPSDGDGGVWREVNDAALQRLDEWVPLLGIEAKRLHNGTWRGIATWKGAENANVGFSSEGIKDWGLDKGLTAIDAVMLSHNADFSTAEKWLREQLGFKDPPLLVFTFPEPDEPVFVEPPPQRIPFFEVNIDPWDHAVAGGLLEKTAQWIMGRSHVPSRELSMLAAIGFMAAFIGRRYLGPTGLGPNLYLVGLAGTGVGKDAPLRAVSKLADEGGMQWACGPGDVGSDAAIEVAVRDKPSTLATLDEFGVLLQSVTAKNASQWSKGIRKTLLNLYSLSSIDGIWKGKDRAGQMRASSKDPVYSPCFSILGMSTPESFFQSLTEENTTDGLLNRLTVVQVPPTRRDRAGRRQPPPPGIPPELHEAYNEALTDWSCEPGCEMHYDKSLFQPYLYPVPWADAGAEDRWYAVQQWQDDAVEDTPNQAKAGIVNRLAEQAIKLALIRAVSRDFAAPAVTEEDVLFGAAIALESVKMLTAGIDAFMAGSEFEANWKTLLRAVDAAPDGLRESLLERARGVSKIEPRRLSEAKDYLTRTGRWEKRRTGKKGYRFFSMAGRVLKEKDDDE